MPRVARTTLTKWAAVLAQAFFRHRLYYLVVNALPGTALACGNQQQPDKCLDQVPGTA